MKSRDLAISSLGIVFISICAQISINFALVPFSLQLFAITLISLTFTKKQVLMCIVSYVIIGLIGLPVFSGYKGGIQMIFSPSFGFILGFILYSFILGSYYKFQNKVKIVLTLIISYVLFYVVGLSVLSLNLNFVLNISVNLNKLLVSYWFVFLPTDMISITVATLISPKLRTITNRKSG